MAPIAMTAEQKILAVLARVERKLDNMEQRVKAIQQEQQDLNRVKRIVRG